MAIIQIPDDASVANNVERRSRLRDITPRGKMVGPKDEWPAWENEPIAGEIVQKTKATRAIALLNGWTTLAGVQKLTIIGHGASAGYLIGPYLVRDQAPVEPIMADEMANLLQRAGYVNGYSIDVIGCFSDYFAKRLSEFLSGIFVKGYTDPVTVEDGLPMYAVDGPKLGKAMIDPHPRGAEEGKKGKYRYLNGVAISKEQYKQMKLSRRVGEIVKQNNLASAGLV
jgi:hypothetical protein